MLLFELYRQAVLAVGLVACLVLAWLDHGVVAMVGAVILAEWENSTRPP